MSPEPLYRSPNGDDWFAVTDEATGEVSVLHRPNAASGGRESRVPAAEFLERGAPGGPEHRALREFLGSPGRVG
jgi:hypothetical protein